MGSTSEPVERSRTEQDELDPIKIRTRAEMALHFPRDDPPAILYRKASRVRPERREGDEPHLEALGLRSAGVLRVQDGTGPPDPLRSGVGAHSLAGAPERSGLKPFPLQN